MTKKASWTPGPWEYEDHDGDMIVAGKRNNICRLFSCRTVGWHGKSKVSTSEAQANARLIAQAPSYHELAKTILGSAVDNGTFWKVDADDIHRLREIQAKAEGRD